MYAMLVKDLWPNAENHYVTVNGAMVNKQNFYK